MSSSFIKINNSKKDAIKTGNWSDPGAKLYDNLLDAFDSRWNVNGRNVFPDDEVAKTWNYWSDFLKEAYLIAPVKDIKNSPYGRTPFSRSGCKYPHHIIRNGELLISIPGLKAAYNRACQEGIMKGEVKDHLERHIKELGIEASFHDGKLSWNESALYNEEDEKYFDEKSHGSLKYEYRIGVDVKTGRLTAIQFKLDPSKILAVGNQTSYDTAYILNDIKPNPEKDEKLRKIYNKIDELRSQGRNKEADDIEKKLNDIFIKKTADARNNALDFMKKNIKKLGHIDYISDESIVDKIFYKDGGSIQSVEIVPTLSNQLYDFLGYLEDNYNVDDFLIRSPYSYNRGPDNWSYSYEMLFRNNDVRNEFIKYCKDNHIKGEKYEVGKSAGKNKYRSTKLLWDSMWMYKKYTKSPVIRGQLNPYKITKNFDTYNGLNKPKREKFAEVNERIEANFNDIYRCILENTGINLFDNISEFEESYLIEHDENNVDPGCEDLIGRTWYGMIRSSNKDVIKESLDWIEKFVNDESFRESTNIFTSGDFDQYKLTDEEFNAIINRDLLDEPITEYGTDIPDSKKDNSEKREEASKSKSKEEFVPIYGIVKCYSKFKLRNDGTEKDQGELNSVKFHKIIKKLTRGDNYSHALVSFDDSLTSMYSYEDEGFCIDNILEKDSWMGTESIYICVMFVNKSDKEMMRKYVKNLAEHADESRYASANLLKAFVGTPYKIDKRFVCSSFTGYIMSCANPKNLHRDYSRLRPEDITILPRAFYVTNVKDREDFIKHRKDIQSKVKDIYNEYHDEIEDYNNHLPKLMLQDRVDKLKTIDKIFDWIIDRM